MKIILKSYLLLKLRNILLQKTRSNKNDTKWQRPCRPFAIQVMTTGAIHTHKIGQEKKEENKTCVTFTTTSLECTNGAIQISSRHTPVFPRSRVENRPLKINSNFTRLRQQLKRLSHISRCGRLQTPSVEKEIDIQLLKSQHKVAGCE